MMAAAAGSRPSWRVLLAVLVLGTAATLCDAQQALGMVAAFEKRLRQTGKQSLLQTDFENFEGAQEYRRLVNHRSIGFITYRTYRLAENQLVVLGLGLTAGLLLPKGSKRSCAWVDEPSGVRREGELKYRTPHESHGAEYETGFLFCELEEGPQVADMRRLLTGAGKDGPKGGYLEITLGELTFVPYREKHAYKVKTPESQGPFKHELVFCGPPVHGAIEPASVSQWLGYHLFHVEDAAPGISAFELSFVHESCV